MVRKILIGIILLSFPAHAIAAEVRVTFDRHKDFSKYRTFSVEIGALVRADGVVDEENTLAENWLREAVTNEFTGRGIESAGQTSDVIVRVSGRETERQELVSLGWNGYPGAWRWRRWGYWRPYGHWGPYYEDFVTRRVLDGSLTVDVIERETGALVYRAEVREEVANDREKQAAKAVGKAFKKFPVKRFTD